MVRNYIANRETNAPRSQFLCASAAVAAPYQLLFALSFALLVCTQPVFPQEKTAETADFVVRIQALNEELRGKPGSGSLDSRAAVAERSDLVSRAAERAELLARLTDSDAERTLSLALTAPEVSALMAMHPELSPHLEQWGEWQGRMEYWISEDLDKFEGEVIRRMRSPDGDLDIHFAGPEPEGAGCGATLDVFGVRIGRKVAAADATLLEPADATAACSPLGEQKVAIILVAFPGQPILDFTPQDAWDIFFGDGTHTVGNYIREISYGKTWFTGGANSV